MLYKPPEIRRAKTLRLRGKKELGISYGERRETPSIERVFLRGRRRENERGRSRYFKKQSRKSLLNYRSLFLTPRRFGGRSRRR